MEPLFISQWTHDNHSLYELVPIFRNIPVVFCLLLCQWSLLLLSSFLLFGEYLVFKITHGLFLCQRPVSISFMYL